MGFSRNNNDSADVVTTEMEKIWQATWENRFWGKLVNIGGTSFCYEANHPQWIFSQVCGWGEKGQRTRIRIGPSSNTDGKRGKFSVENLWWAREFFFLSCWFSHKFSQKIGDGTHPFADPFDFLRHDVILFSSSDRTLKDKSFPLFGISLPLLDAKKKWKEKNWFHWKIRGVIGTMFGCGEMLRHPSCIFDK